MEYVTTTFTTEIKITCLCGDNLSKTIVQDDELSIEEIDLTLHKLRCWLVQHVGWVRIKGKLLCGKCESDARNSSREGWTKWN